MRQIEEIKAIIREAIATEKSEYENAVRHKSGNEARCCLAAHDRLKALMAKIEAVPTVWHDISERPRYIKGETTKNTIAVTGDTSVGPGMSVGTMVDEDEIYAPVSEKVYKWGECPFARWAYITDLMPEELIKK